MTGGEGANGSSALWAAMGVLQPGQSQQEEAGGAEWGRGQPTANRPLTRISKPEGLELRDT